MVHRRLLVSICAIVGAATMAAPAAVPVASATSLGGVTSRRLGAWTLTGGSTAPTVLTWDGFTRPVGTDLNNAATGGGPVWRVIRGTWITATNQAQDKPSAQNAAVVVDCGRVNATVTAVLLPGPTAYAGGVAFKSNGTNLLYAYYRNQSGGSVEVGKVVNGNATPLASSANVGAGVATTVSAAYAGGLVTIRINGVTVLTVSLSAADVTAFGANTRNGLYADNDSQTLFDDFRCESP
jgi:hypothetical protein